MPDWYGGIYSYQPQHNMPKDRSKLIAKRELVQRDGKVYTTTVYIDPNKAVKTKPKRVKAKLTPVTERKYVGTTRLDHADLKRGDKVTATYQGQVVEAEFRHIAVTPRYPQGKAVLSVRVGEGTKLIERNLEEVTPVIVGKEQKFERLITAADYSLGDKVKFSTRQKTADGTPFTEEVYGTLSRFKGEPDSRGQLIHIKLDNGEIKERYLHNVTRYDARIDPLTPEQSSVVNRAIDNLRNANKVDFALVKVFNGKRGGVERVEELKLAINERNLRIQKQLQVLRRELPFEHVVEDVKGIGEDGEDEQGKYRMTILGKMYKIAPAPKVEKVSKEKEERYVKPELTTDELVAQQVATNRANVAHSLQNMNRYANKPDYPSQLQHYRSTRNFQLHMQASVAYKQEQNLELTEAEGLYALNPPNLPTKPLPPVEAVKEDVRTPMTRTVTTVSKNVKKRQIEATNDDKRKELTDLIAKTKALGLTPETTDKLLARYQEKLDKLGPAKVRAAKGANTKSILADLAKIANGQVAAGFRINERIMALDASDAAKQALKLQFSTSIRTGLAKRKAGEKEVRNVISRKTEFEAEDGSDSFDKAVTIPEAVFANLAQNNVVTDGVNNLMSKTLYSTLNDMFALDKLYPTAQPQVVCNAAGVTLDIVTYHSNAEV